MGAVNLKGAGVTWGPTLKLDLVDSSELVSTEYHLGRTSNAPRTVILQVNPEYSESMDPTYLSSLNELLDRIRAMGIFDGRSSVYDQIGLKPNNREIYTPPVTHLIATIEDLVEGSHSPELKTDYAWVSGHPIQATSSKSDVHPGRSPGSSPDSKHDPESAQQYPVDNPDSKPGASDTAVARDTGAKALDPQLIRTQSFSPPTPMLSTLQVTRGNQTYGI